ncbi:MAG: folate-binding protein [Pseudomonadota bacterium]
MRIDGDDRYTFLQGLITNDVNLVGSDRSIYAAFLTPQGKFLHDFTIIAAGDALLIDMDGDPDLRADFTRRLKIYKLRAQVTITDVTDDWAVMALVGKDALGSVELPADAGATIAFAGGYALVDPRTATMGARLLLPAGSQQQVVNDLAAAAGNLDMYDHLRISLGVPDGRRDLEREKSTVLEATLDRLNGVSWSKGCYMGQELTARTHYRGLMKRRLVPVELEGPTPEQGADLIQDGKTVGAMRSTAGEVGIVLMRLDALEQSAPIMAGETKITPRRAVWEAS